MALTLNTLAPAKGSREKKFRVGRGEGSGRGKTAGKGTKGQRARTGGRKGLKLKGIKQMILGFPKLRGFQSRFEKPATVSLKDISDTFDSNQKIDVAALKSKHLISKSAQFAKVVGTGEIDKPFVFMNVTATATAKAAIEKAGGSFKKDKGAASRAKAAKAKEKAAAKKK